MNIIDLNTRIKSEQTRTASFISNAPVWFAIALMALVLAVCVVKAPENWNNVRISHERV